jgi:ribosomal protein L37AE/L43A
MTERAVPFHCPYCGDEDLRPHEDVSGAWDCRSCLRSFSLKMLGLITRPTTPDPFVDPASDPVDTVEVNR